jgi:anti-sigma factor ChrR (cupin superfamily)
VSNPILRLRLEEDFISWQATRFPGISWRPLNIGEPSPGEAEDTAVLIRMDPGCGYPPHRHRGTEDVLILHGGYRDEQGVHSAGTYLRYPAGSTHSPVATGDPHRPPGTENPACILFAVARGGVENL